MSVNRRIALSVMLTASLGAGVTVTAAGCGGSSPAAAGTPAVTAPAAASPSPSASASGSPVNAALLVSVIRCLRSHGLAVADSAPLKQVKVAFKALPVAEQQRDFTACGSLLPATIRQKVAERIADEEAARPTASP
jgi:hypothetical protein